MNAAEPLKASDLERFCDYLYQRTGMTYGESKRYYIERRVADRMRATGEARFGDYFARLRSEPAELEAMINAFTVNETYFYREDHQLRCLSRSILPAVAATKGPGDKIRIWSLPCSTGEEPYSIAIWLLENWPMVDAYNVEIVGSDIDTEALEAARAGRYGERALSRLPADVVDRYFEQAGEGDREIISDLKESVLFSPANLIEGSTLSGHGQFEVIFCRNVLIYFDDAARARAIDNLFTALKPGGYICLGHTESMSRITDRFRACRFPDAVVYQRPEAPS
ncbi:protein-glutamate O-methyltransferase CheR [Phenylobacterium sp.]|jgi:chemotaxis protein methyltransferase CheR|uniref:CheR family methyltransferase n=1 Tax=Phenylobacterium sp. TaxID=1871053 RepID=UPI002F93512C